MTRCNFLDVELKILGALLQISLLGAGESVTIQMKAI